MRIVSIIIAFIAVSANEACNAQNNHTISLRELSTDSCLSVVLKTVESADAESRFPPNIYYYTLQVENAEQYKKLVIVPRQWAEDLPNDCRGVVKIGKMNFVVCGDVDESKLFYDKKKDVELAYDFSNFNYYDSLDQESNFIDWEKSPTAVIGSLRSCDAGQIDLYINVGKRLKNLQLSSN